jgi:hypothetical protein
LDLELRKRRLEGSHRTDYCTHPQDRGTILRSFDRGTILRSFDRGTILRSFDRGTILRSFDRGTILRSFDRGTILRSFDTDCNYTESTGIGSSYTDSIDTASIRHKQIDT